MPIDLAAARREANHARYRPGQPAGHYESFFLRANHPTRPLAFWIRYTLFSPDGRPDDAIGEKWAIVFDGETGTHVAVKTEVPIARARFDRDAFHADVDGAELGPGMARGEAAAGSHTIAWDLGYEGDEAPIFLFPLRFYETSLPKAKSLVAEPLARFSGSITVDGRAIDVGGWLGSQNHNWGARHTDRYAWGQVAGFDGYPESFLEVGTGQLKVGPIWSPQLTLLVLRHEGREIALNTPGEALWASASVEGLTWRFRSSTAEVAIEGKIDAAAGDFVGLAYRNPPGGVKHCYNTKIASCELAVTHKTGGGGMVRLFANRRAAFEILTDELFTGVPIRV